MKSLNYNSDHQLKAFTIVELLIVTILTTLLSIFALSALKLFQQQYLLYDKIASNTLNVQHFSNLFLCDLKKASTIILNQNRIECRTKNIQINYQYENDFILRTNSLSPTYVDTFDIKVNELVGTFNSKEVENGIIDDVQIILELFEKENSIHLSKNYSAKDLINYFKHEY